MTRFDDLIVFIATAIIGALTVYLMFAGVIA